MIVGSFRSRKLSLVSLDQHKVSRQSYCCFVVCEAMVATLWAAAKKIDKSCLTTKTLPDEVASLDYYR
jgi:hypothetical protein